MSDQVENPSVFPQQYETRFVSDMGSKTQRFERVPTTHGGLTLLDWFAGMALQGMMANPNLKPELELTSSAYSIAAAMLRARKDYAHG